MQGILQPLAERMRPHNFDDFAGQQHLVGKGSVLRQMIQGGTIPSMILWGPPGVGKTTLAQIIADNSKRPFYNLSAINSGVKDVREVIEKARNNRLLNHNKPILFIDEIHRFSKSQQDSLLGAVEKGDVTLIGATTENPSFEVIAALLSRCQVYVLKHLEMEDLIGLLHRAMQEDEWLKNKNIVLEEHSALLRLSGGDARKLLNIFELVASGHAVITDQVVVEAVQQNPVLYDKDGEQHYDIVSAFIKSIRGSDPNAALYWLARMIEGGEDPLFIARRLLILSSEDIGNANPTALVMANSCFQAVNAIGWPESRIILAQCVTYLAASAKSNASYEAVSKAQELVQQTGNLSVPLHLRNAPTKLMKQLNYGKEYKYAHGYEGNFVDQEFLPETISGTLLYNPGKSPREEEMRSFLRSKWKNKYGY